MWTCTCGRQNSDVGNFCVACGSNKGDILSIDLSEDTQWYYYKGGERLGPVAAKEIEAFLRAEVIDRKTLVWKAGMSDWRPLAQTALNTLAVTVLPPVPLEAASDKYAWAIVMMPICQFILELIGIPTVPNIIVVALINIFLWLLDMNEMSNTHNKVGLWGILGIIFMPAYLFVRGHKLGRKYGYAIVYCVLLICIFIISAVISAI